MMSATWLVMSAVFSCLNCNSFRRYDASLAEIEKKKEENQHPTTP